MSTTKGVLTAFLIGGAIGAGAALLFAPASGVETRRRIKEGVDDAGGWAKDRFEGARTAVTDTTGKVKQMVAERKEDLNAAYEIGKEAFYKGKEKLVRES